MWGSRYWNARYWTTRYWLASGFTVVYPGCVVVSHAQIGDVVISAVALMDVTLTVAQIGDVTIEAFCIDGDEMIIFFFDDNTPVEFDSGTFVEAG